MRTIDLEEDSKAEEDRSSLLKRIATAAVDEEEGNSSPSADYLIVFLESAECSAFIDGKAKAVEEFLAYADDTIINYICNDIMRQKLLLASIEMEESITGHEPGNISCKLAFDMKMFENLPELLDYLVTFEACEEEVTLELDILHGRRLEQEEDSKSLNSPICFGLPNTCFIDEFLELMRYRPPSFGY